MCGVRCQVSGVRCQVSGVRCQVSGVRCQVSSVRPQVSNLRPQVAGLSVKRISYGIVTPFTYFATLNIILVSIFIVTLTCTRKLNHRFAFAGSAIR